jgi:hypothetical protein
VGGKDARPRPAATTLDLAAFHGERDVIAAGIAADDLELGAENTVENARKLIGIGSLAGATDDELLFERIFKLGDAARLPGDADAHLVVGAADPGELVGLELSALGAQQRIECGAAADSAQCSAVLRPDIVEPIGKTQASRALQVLGHDGRIAGDVLAEMAGQHAGIKVIGTAHAVADIEIDFLAPVEFRRRLRVSKRCRQRCEGADRDAADPNPNAHRATFARAQTRARFPLDRTSRSPSP